MAVKMFNLTVKSSKWFTVYDFSSFLHLDANVSSHLVRKFSFCIEIKICFSFLGNICKLVNAVNPDQYP